MSNSTPPPTDDSSGEINLRAGRDANVGGDVVGRDKVVQVGYSPAAVQRLLITVGVLVFVTAACFFSGGVATGGAIAVLLQDRPASPEAAQMMQNKLNFIQNQPAGAPFQETFTEVELNSYVKYIAGPQMGFAPGTGEARILDNGQLAISGRLEALGNLRVVAIFAPQTGPTDQLLKPVAAAVEILPLNNPAFGWVAAPPTLLADLDTSVNSALAGVEFTSVTTAPGELTVSGVGH